MQPVKWLVAAALLLSGAASAGTVAYYRFENADAADSVSGVAGTPIGGPTFPADVPVDPVPLTGAANKLSVHFNGSGARIEFPQAFPLDTPGDATLEFWLDHPATGHEALFWGRPDSSDTNRFHIYVNGDQTLGVDYRDASGALFPVIGPGTGSNGAPITFGVWQHVALVRQGNVYRLYVNGTLEVTQTDPAPHLPTSVGWGLASRDGFPFLGSVDEVRFSDAALTPDQFLDSGSPPPVIHSVAASPSSLWPPNHKMVSVALSLDLTSGASWWIDSVTSSEPASDEPDFLFGGQALSLRAERSGFSPGRTYTVTVKAKNAAGRTSAPASVKVTVPHNQ